MIINLCFNSSKVLKIIEQYPNEMILDITGVLYKKKITNKLVLARETDKDGSIEKRALNNYIETIGKLSNHKINKRQLIRDVKIKDIPIYWLTPITEKHDSFHWGQVVFYLLQLIKEKKELFENNLYIILHKAGNTELSLKKNIENLIQKIKIEFLNSKTQNTTTQLFVKIWVREFLYFTKFKIKYIKKNKKTPLKDKIFFITPEIEAVNNNNSNFDIGWQKDILLNTNNNSYNIPYIHTFSNVPNFSNNSALKLYLNSQPSFLDFLSITISVFSNYLKIKNKLKESFNSKLFHLDSDLLISELRNVLSKPSFFINYLFIRNFAKQIKTAQFYYSDELYSTGRLISFVIEKSNNTTIGVQHGLIMENHTVYRITDSEQSGKNIIPLPNKIIVWDKIFKKRILKNTKNIEKRLIINENKKYEEFIVKIRKKKEKYSKKKEGRYILWCTTLPEHFIFEAEIIKSIDFNKYKILIRLHPAMYINKTFINNTLKNIPYEITNDCLVNDFSLADIVVTNPFSTIFYDAIRANIPVIRILNYSTFIDFKTDFNTKLFNVWTTEDIELTLNKIKWNI